MAAVVRRLGVTLALPSCLQESTVVPLLMQGMQQLCKDRPEDPVEYLAVYLLKANEEAKKAKAATTASEAPKV